MNQEENIISFGASESVKSNKTFTSDKVSLESVVPVNNKVNLEMPSTNDLSDQVRNGICTACATRMAAEKHFDDGVRLAEWWLYFMGKVFYDGNLLEGSSAFTMLRTAYTYGIPTKKIADKYPLNINGTYDQLVASFNTYGRIPQEILDDAKNHKIPGYYQITDLSPYGFAKELSQGRLPILRMIVGDNTYKDINGNVPPNYSAKALLPWRAPKVVEGGHLIAMNENRGLSDIAFIGCPQSWGRRYCPDNTDQGAGYVYFFFGVQQPYITEAWAIKDSTQKYIFNHDLTIGSIGADVVALQKYLVAKGFMVMPANVAYGYFGTVTQTGVSKYQIKYGIKPSAGYFGPITRAYLNANQ